MSNTQRNQASRGLPRQGAAAVGAEFRSHFPSWTPRQRGQQLGPTVAVHAKIDVTSLTTKQAAAPILRNNPPVASLAFP